MNYDQLTGLIPIYLENGQNGVMILLKDGTTLTYPIPLKKSLRTFLFSLHLDINAIRYWTHQTIGVKNNTPITISDNLILIPIKMRHPVAKQDGCFAYLNKDHILSYDDYTITLCNNKVLPTLSNKNYVQHKLSHASHLYYAYREQRKPHEFMWSPSTPKFY